MNNIGIKDISWEKVRLGEICIIHGGNPSPKEPEFSEEGMPFIKMKDLGAYHFTTSLEKVEYRVSMDIIRSKRLKVIKRGSILLPRSGSVALNHRAILAQDSVIVSHICALEIIDEERVFNKFLYFYLTTIDMVKITKKTTGLDAITFEDLSQITVPLPPLSIQKRIATILDKADALRRKDQELLKKYDELSQANFIEIFGDPVRNEKGWETIRLGEICDKITDGTHLSPKFTTSGVPFLFVSNIIDNKIDYQTDTFISEEEYLILTKRTPVEIGSILLTTVGSYGNPAIIEKEDKFCFQRHIAFIKPNHNKINYKYLFGVLKSEIVKIQIESKVRGVAQKTLNLNDLKEIKIWLPPIQLQTKYSSLQDNLNLQKEQLINVQQKSNILSQSLLQQAFRGELN